VEEESDSKLHYADRWATSLCGTIDTLQQLEFESGSPGERLQERLAYAAKVYRDAKKEDDNAINLQKTNPDFKRGFIFAMRAIIDMVESKDGSYSGTHLVEFLHNFLLVNSTLDNIEDHKKMNNEIRVKLDEQDFRCLVSGGVLKIKIPDSKQEIKICLADIGFHIMDQAISDIEIGKMEPYSNLTRENQSGWL
jgi:hypothetical protein